MGVGVLSKKSLFAASLILALPGCGVAPPLPAGTAAPRSCSASYVLGPGDKIRLDVFNEANLSDKEFVINGDGEVSLPLIQAVKLGGKTTIEAAELVRSRYAGDYLDNPQVSITVTMFRPFYILGQVNAPGEYPYVEGLTVLNAAAKASGLNSRANERFVYITRAGQNQETLVQVTPNEIVCPGDTVRVVERFF